MKAVNSAVAERPVYPVRVSEDGRYFVDQKGNPFFWLGTTQWQIFREHTLDEAKTILENVKDKGFTVVQAMLLGVGGPKYPNAYGEMPWLDNNPATPNDAYFKNIDSIVQMACENDLVLVVGVYHRVMGSCIDESNARAWAKWVAQRYRNVQNIIWSMYPVADQRYVMLIREIASGLQEGDGGSHIVTVHPDPSPASSSTILHNESWLAFNSIQTWRDVDLIYPMVRNDYSLKPVKPVVMAEGAYEEGSEYGFDVTSLWIRRQAYYTYLAGGHHSYGHNDSWRLLPTWKDALDAPGALQMRVLKIIFLDRKEWWNLVPDQSIFASGGQTRGDLLNLAARHRGGEWIIVYLASKTSFSVNMNKITADNEMNAFWIDPRTGDSISIGASSNTGVESFSTPDEWEDAVLVLES